MRLVLLLLLWSVSCTTEYPLSDIQFPVPTCEVREIWTVENNFGSLQLSNTALPEGLTVSVTPDSSQRSCRFCTQSMLGCFTPFDRNHTDDENVLHLAYDTTFNIRIMTLDAQNHTSTVLVALPETLALDPVAIDCTHFGSNGCPLCGQTLRLIVNVIMRSESPYVRDFVLVARQWNTQFINCSSDPTQADLSCRVAPRYFYLQYPVVNCLTSGPVPPLAAASLHHSFYYYYYEAVAMGNAEVLANATLCGESWLSIYTRSRLYIYCNADVSRYLTLLPWYSSALVTIAAWTNGRRDTAIWIALHQLEQYCALRDLPIPYWLNVSVPLNDQRSNWQLDQTTLCEWVQLENINTLGNVTLPLYYTYAESNAWFFQPFRMWLYFNDPVMQTKSILLITFFIVSGLIALGFIGGTVYVMWRQRESALNAYSRL
jgi:hypothetical protein